jgi:hypothetical protein
VLHDVTFAVVLFACVLSLGLGAAQLHRRQSLVLSRSGFGWEPSDWKLRGWMSLATGVALGIQMAVIAAQSQYVDLLGIAAAIVWLALVVRYSMASGARR